MIKVSRRDRRALERMSGPKPPSSRLLAIAIAVLLFAVGFLVGRVGTIEPQGPSVRALPAVEPLMPFDVEGSVVYLLWTPEQLATIASHDIYSGDVTPRARLSPPFDVSDEARTKVVALGRSVALVTADEERSFVALAPSGKAVHGWIPGVDAAWASPDELLVLDANGSVSGWSVRDGGLRSRDRGHADKLFQTTRGATVQRSGRLTSGSGNTSIGYPRGSIVLATDGKRALVSSRNRTQIIDGDEVADVRVDQAGVLSASFEPNGDRVALVLWRDGAMTVAVVDAKGNAALKPLGVSSRECTPSVTWDRSSRWVYVGAGDEALHAIEASGGHVESVRTRSVGCGLAWIDAG